MAFIEFVDVCKHYPGNAKPAVEQLNLQIEKGEFLTLLGPSGSGKTTMLMMLAGFESVSSGTIRLDGQPIEQRAAAPAQHGHGVPELFAVPAHDGGAERRLSAVGAQGRRERDRRARASRARSRCTWPISPQRRPNAALGRPAAARRAGARAGVRAEPGADGRAAGCTRQAAARGDAARDPAPAPRPRRDDGLRHARPGARR